MNQGKRYIRNTVLAILGVTVLLPGASRLHAAVVDADSPPWLGRLMSLGLRAHISQDPMQKAVDVRMEDAGQLRFSRVSVEGNFTVEVIAAPLHKVSLTGINGQADSVAVRGQKDGLLLLKGAAGSEGAVLRIEAPALTSIDLENVPQLTLRGLQVPELSIRTKNVPRVRLEENDIDLWNLRSETPVVVEADKSTIAAGLNILARGAISLHGAGEQSIDFRGVGGLVSYRSPDGEISIRSGP